LNLIVQPLARNSLAVSDTFAVSAEAGDPSLDRLCELLLQANTAVTTWTLDSSAELITRLSNQQYTSVSASGLTLLQVTGQESPRPLSGHSKALIQLMNSWLNDDSGYDERTWPALKKAIEEDRLSSRKRFRA
jgi:hypothetical protein